MHTAGVEVNFR